MTVFELLSGSYVTVLANGDELVMEHVDEILLTEEWSSTAIPCDDLKDDWFNFLEDVVELKLVF